MLRELYSVVVGLALLGALQNLIEKSPTAGVFIHWNLALWFGAVFVTLLPFYHGALRYLDDVYILGPRKPKRLALLVDYLFLFSEACLLVVLGLLLARPEAFTPVFATLIGVDIIWALAGYFITETGFGSIWRWLLINLVTLFVLAAITYTPFLSGAKPYHIVCLAFLRTISDYIWCWDMYFPEPQTSKHKKGSEGSETEREWEECCENENVESRS